MSVNYYTVLGVSEDATQEEIKKAYRKLAREWHSDQLDPDASEAKRQVFDDKLKEINEAHGVLEDPERRKAYDQELAEPEKPAPGSVDNSNWTPEEWELYWAWGGTDMPDEWTDPLRNAFERQFGTAPPGQAPPKPPPPPRATVPSSGGSRSPNYSGRAYQTSAAIESNIPTGYHRLASLVLLALGTIVAIALLNDLHPIQAFVEGLSGVHEGAEHKCESPGAASILLILIGIVAAIVTGGIAMAAIVAFPAGLIAMTVFALGALFNRKALGLAISSALIGFGSVVVASLCLRVTYFLIYGTC